MTSMNDNSHKVKSGRKLQANWGRDNNNDDEPAYNRELNVNNEHNDENEKKSGRREQLVCSLWIMDLAERARGKECEEEKMSQVECHC